MSTLSFMAAISTPLPSMCIASWNYDGGGIAFIMVPTISSSSRVSVMFGTYTIPIGEEARKRR